MYTCHNNNKKKFIHITKTIKQKEMFYNIFIIFQNYSYCSGKCEEHKNAMQKDLTDSLYERRGEKGEQGGSGLISCPCNLISRRHSGARFSHL